MSDPTGAEIPKRKPKRTPRQFIAARLAPVRAQRDNFSAWVASFDAAGVLVDVQTVLKEELKEIHSRRRAARLPPVAIAPETPPTTDDGEKAPPGGSSKESRPTALAGIALSGGGVRSATFCLGVLQALQERGVLRVFDYISTVSGGGFVGGWWSAWLARQEGAQSGPPKESFPPLEQIEGQREEGYRTGSAPDIDRGCEMSAEVVDAPTNTQDPVHHLRLFSNYLTPRKGALSADTWRAAAVISRNLALTWLVLLPLLVGVMALGQIYFLTTPANALGFVCPPVDSASPRPACDLVQAQLDSLPVEFADSARAVTPHHDQVLVERLRFAIRPVLLLVGLLVVTTLIWLLTAARDLPQLAGIVVGIGAALTLLHAVAERFTPPKIPFHGGDALWITILKYGALVIVAVGWAYPMMRDERFLTGRGRDDRREVRTNLVTRIHAVLLGSAIATIVVLAIGGFAPDFFDFISIQLRDEGEIARMVARAGGSLAVLTSIAGTVVTLWSAAPAGGGDTKREEPSTLRRVLLQVTPMLVLILLAVLIATVLRFGLAHLPPPGPAARTPFFAIVPATLVVAWLAARFSRRRLRKANDSDGVVRLDRTIGGLEWATGASLVALVVYWLARPLKELEPLGTSILVAVLLSGFFTIFEYVTDENETPRATRVGIVVLAGVVALVALVAGVVMSGWSPLDWVSGTSTNETRRPAAMFVGITMGLVLARCSVGWAKEGGRSVLRSRIRRFRKGKHRTAFAFGSLLTGMAVGGLVGWWLAAQPIPFDAQRADIAGIKDETRRFASFCFAALAFTSAFIVADLGLSRSDSRRVLWLQVLAVGLLGPTLMQQFLNPLAPSVLFVNTNLAFVAIAIAMVMGLGWLVDPNLISLHTFYRARLVRAYLGASNPARTGNVTEASEGDDMPLSELGNSARGGPVHLVNATLNLVGGRDLVTAQRSSANFTLSSLYCGSLRTGYRLTQEYMDNRMTLGTALAISGAAASPNMGSKTPSAALAMWLAFLNVRLGFWAPTPGKPRWRSPQARLWPFYLLSECLSQTNDLGSYCYLTDGGHFDNTGLYALVERGCRYIVVVDCGADPQPAFSDIGDAVRRCRIDFDAEIQLDVARLQKDEKGFAQSHYVVGKIVFSDAHARQLGWGADLPKKKRSGKVVWVKPSRLPDDSADVTQYALENKGFPQQTTGDQWYSEAQFESYRQLGYESGRAALGPEKSHTPNARLDPRELFDRLAGYYAELIEP